MFAGFRSKCPRVFGRSTASRCAREPRTAFLISSISSPEIALPPDAREAGSEVTKPAKNGSTSNRKEPHVKSRAPAERRVSVAGIDMICRPARLAATSSHARESGFVDKQTPEASAASQALHSGLLARIFGGRDGHGGARAVVTQSTRALPAPTALNHAALPLVSKRIKLKRESALNCWNDPVRCKAKGRSTSATQLDTSVT